VKAVVALMLTSALSFDLDQRSTGEHVMLALRKTEGILAMSLKSRYKTREQLINRRSGSPRLQEKLDDEILKIRLCIEQ
jgi:hypothetical protein